MGVIPPVLGYSELPFEIFQDIVQAIDLELILSGSPFPLSLGKYVKIISTHVPVLFDTFMSLNAILALWQDIEFAIESLVELEPI